MTFEDLDVDLGLFDFPENIVVQKKHRAYPL